MAFEAFNRLVEGLIDSIKKVEFRLSRLERFIRGDKVEKFSEIAIGFVLGQSITENYSKFAIDVCIPDLKEKRVIAYPLSIMNGFIMPNPYSLVLVLKDVSGKYFYLGNAIGLDDNYLNSFVNKITDIGDGTASKVSKFKIHTLEGQFKEIYDLIFKNFVPYDKLDSDLIDLLLVHPIFKPEFAVSYNKTTKNLIHFYKNWMRVSHIFYDYGAIDFSVMEQSKDSERLLSKLMFNINVGSGYFQVAGSHCSLLIDNIIPTDSSIPNSEKLKHIGFKYLDRSNKNMFQMVQKEILLERKYADTTNGFSSKLHIIHDNTVDDNNKGNIQLVVNSGNNQKEAGLDIRENGTITLYESGNSNASNNGNSSFIQLLSGTSLSSSLKKVIIYVNGLHFEVIRETGGGDATVTIYDDTYNSFIEIDFKRGNLNISDFNKVFIGDQHNPIQQLSIKATDKVIIEATSEVTIMASQINFQGQTNISGSLNLSNGNISSSGDMSCNGSIVAVGDISSGGNISATGDITSGGDVAASGSVFASNDVIAGNISLKYHKHISGAPGNQTGPAIP